MFGLDSLKYQPSTWGAAYVSTQPQPSKSSPEDNKNVSSSESFTDKNIFAVRNENSSVNGLSSYNAGTASGVSRTARPAEDTGIVSCLDRIDASIIKPDTRDALRGQWIYTEG